jgi:hypothetical protein
MDAEAERLLVELIEKVGLLKRDLQHKRDLERYEARIARIDQKLGALVAAVNPTNAALGKALETAWKQPARSLAFRNAEHRKETGPSG